jgi:hypothetical protein
LKTAAEARRFESAGSKTDRRGNNRRNYEDGLSNIGSCRNCSNAVTQATTAKTGKTRQRRNCGGTENFSSSPGEKVATPETEESEEDKGTQGG